MRREGRNIIFTDEDFPFSDGGRSLVGKRIKVSTPNMRHPECKELDYVNIGEVTYANLGPEDGDEKMYGTLVVDGGGIMAITAYLIRGTRTQVIVYEK